MAEQPDVASWRRSPFPAMTVGSEPDEETRDDDVVRSLNRLFNSPSAPRELIPDDEEQAPKEPALRPFVQDPAFAAQLEQLLSGAELAAARSRTHELEAQLAEATRNEDYAAAAALRDELAPLYAADPSVVAERLRQQLADLVRAERFSEAARVRDQMIVLRRFQPQFQLAGLWKGHYPNHGDALVRFTYEGDTLVATKVTGDDHVPAGQITFRADVAAVDSEPFEEESRIEVVRVSNSGDSEPMDVEKYRGEGCVAAKGYQRAHYIPGQLHLMDGEELDLVGFHWAALGTFVMFSRATEEEGRAAVQAAKEAES